MCLSIESHIAFLETLGEFAAVLAHKPNFEKEFQKSKGAAMEPVQMNRGF